MPRRHPKRFLVAPRDPRARRVIASRTDARFIACALECGHVESRRLFCAPHSLICTQCPPAGGMAGNRFAPQGED